MRFKKETYSLHTQYVLYLIPYNPTMGPMGVMTPAARAASNPPKANAPQELSESLKIWGATQKRSTLPNFNRLIVQLQLLISNVVSTPS